MEVDTAEIDLELLNRLTTMSTRDKEDLLAQFQSIVGNQMSPGGCSFYLEMGNWNLQAALGAYYDIMSVPDRLPSFEIVEETHHTDEYSLSPNQTFVKTWRVRNTGTEIWNANLRLKFVKGQIFGHGEHVSVPPIAQNEIADISIPMVAPDTDGLFHSQWRFITTSGTYCGNPFFVSVNVDRKIIASLTEQMSTLRSDDGNSQHSQPISTPFRPAITATPFCSPTGYGIFGGSSVPLNSLNGHLPTINEANLLQSMQRNNILNELDGTENQSDSNSGR